MLGRKGQPQDWGDGGWLLSPGAPARGIALRTVLRTEQAALVLRLLFRGLGL